MTRTTNHHSTNGKALKLLGPTESLVQGPIGWSAHMAKSRVPEKQAMARYFVAHDFLAQPGKNAETDPLMTAATILVNAGTTPDTVVGAALEWMRENWNRGPFNVRWYTPGALVPGRLLQFRNLHQEYRNVAMLFVFPGEVDPEVESVVGDDPVQFAKSHLKTRFTHSILSAHRFDLGTGEVFFHYRAEIGVQSMCAKLQADHKFLFLDTGKFQGISGEPAYHISELLATSQTVTVYTVTSDRDAQIQVQFEALREKVLAGVPEHVDEFGNNKLRLCIVSTDGEQAVPPSKASAASARRRMLRNS